MDWTSDQDDESKLNSSQEAPAEDEATKAETEAKADTSKAEDVHMESGITCHLSV